MKTSDSLDLLATALSAAQAEISPAEKDSLNPHFKNKYADLTSVWAACREPLSKHGLSILQSPSFAEGRMVLTTRLMHKSGQWIEDELSIKPAQDTAQAIGSCITYAKRYALCAMVGVVADEDDDGHMASRTPAQQQTKTPPPAKGTVVFNRTNERMVAALNKWLDDISLPVELRDEVYRTLHGKPFTRPEVEALLAAVEG